MSEVYNQDELLIKIRSLEREVSTLKQTERMLRQIEEKHRLITETTSDLISITTFNLKPVFTYLNHAHRTVLGYEPDALIGQSAFKYMHGDDKKKLLPLLKTYFKQKGIMFLTGKNRTLTELIEYRVIDQWGKWHFLQSTVNIIGKELLFVSKDITDSKKAEGMLKKSHEDLEKRVRERTAELGEINKKLKTEIAEHEKTEKALLNSEKRLKMLFEFAPDAYYLNDLKGTFIDGNKAAEEMIGYEKEALLGKSFLKLNLLPANQIPKAMSMLTKNAMGKRTGPDEFVLRKKDGTKITVEISTFPVEIRGKTLILGIARDISIRKKSELELKMSKEAAEVANRAKSSFLANMSHELRTPLNHIIGFTVLILDKKFGDLNPSQEEYLNDILESSRHLLSLINDILDLSKVEAGKEVLEKAPVLIKVFFENSMIVVKEKAMKHGIQLKIDTHNLPEVINADERKLKQIVYNLLSNAVKFTPDGGTVHLSAQRIDEAGYPQTDDAESQNEAHFADMAERDGRPEGDQRQWIQCTISDTGIGIDPQYQKRIFKPFEQVDGSKNRKFEGTGLGLSLTKKLIELHGGEIWLESEGEGRGSKFIFTIPI